MPGCGPAGGRTAARARSTGSSAWWSSPAMRPGRCCRWSGCGWSGAACCTPSATCSARRPVAPLDEILALGLASSPTPPDQGLCDGGPRRSTRFPAPSELVQRLRPPWWSSLRVAAEALCGAVVGALPLGRRRRRSGVARRADRGRLQCVAEEPPRNPWLPGRDRGVLAVVGEPGRRPRPVRPRLLDGACPAAGAREARRDVAVGGRRRSPGRPARSARRGWPWSRSGRRCWPASRIGSARVLVCGGRAARPARRRTRWPAG